MSRRLGNRYELYEQIGGGGMAVVYRAVDTVLGRTVAVKMLRAQYVGDDDLVTRFRQEAQSVAKLAHPNIVNIYDVGVADEEDYIVMEYVDGPTLKDIIRERGPLSAQETIEITQQICQALDHAHSNHIIHRDVKPHNILLTKAGHVKVTDFGIARAITGNTVTYHNEKSVLGSVHYFSPEQARGGTADVKSDIYSLGVVMYEMLTGRLPFSGDSAVSVALKHLRDEFVDPRSLNPSIPQSLENVVLRCLVKSPELRYADMRAVQQDLNQALANPDVPKFQMPESVTQATIAVPAIQDDSQSYERQRSAEQEVKQTGKKSVWKTLMWIGVAVAVLVVGAVAAYYIVMGLLKVPNADLPNVVGKTETQAMQELTQTGFQKTQISEQYGTSSQPKGTVYQQDPQSGLVKLSRDITLYISKGPKKFDMPPVAGVTVDQAKMQLNSNGFANIKVVQVLSTTVPQGYVISSTPKAGTKVTSDETVTLKVSKGAPQVTIPDVVGKSIETASQLLQQAGLNPGNITQETNSAPAGTVLSISPNKVGDKVDKGTSINLVLSDGSGANNTTNSTGGSAPTNSTNNSTNSGSNNNVTGVSNSTASSNQT